MHSDEQIIFIKKGYLDRWNTKILSIDPGVENIFGGDLAIATYIVGENERVSDIIYIDKSKCPHIFETTQELLLFLRDKSRFRIVEAVFETKLFPGFIFLGLLMAMCWLGSQGTGSLNDKVLTILGSVIGLAAGMFFGRQHA
jgi:hypothetical protein